MLTAAAHKIAVAVAFVPLTVWLLIGSWQSSPYSSQAAQKQSAKKTDERTEHNEPWLTKDAAGFFTFWLVVVSVFQVGLFYVQLRLIKQSLTPAQEAAEAARDAAKHIPVVERAYIYGGANYQVTRVNNGERLDLVLKINNFGKTPAFIGTVAATICSEDDIDRPITWQVEEWAGWVLPAPTPDLHTGVTLPFVRYGDVIIGRIWYRDIFSDCHSSGFVLRLNPDGLPAVGAKKHWEDRPEPNLGPAEPESA
jgi:hypothetical protein